jgi:hypothetical protein
VRGTVAATFAATAAAATSASVVTVTITVAVATTARTTTSPPPSTSLHRVNLKRRGSATSIHAVHGIVGQVHTHLSRSPARARECDDNTTTRQQGTAATMASAKQRRLTLLRFSLRGFT